MRLQVQIACAEAEVPSRDQFESWAAAALATSAARGGKTTAGEVTIRVVGRAEMSDLNRRYRGRDGATDVLAFAFDGEGAAAPLDILGDVVICAPVLAAEAARREIPELNHWAHLTAHGVLHLCGFDHGADADAREMGALEREILAEFGIALDGESAASGNSTAESPSPADSTAESPVENSPAAPAMEPAPAR
ncbi:MAG: rRNA maturation RNase YbeY [Gammaproteobacteria bacterium]|nr:rRNA maturation RNase YbeY [Gammaproteobacteria bacterium]